MARILLIEDSPTDTAVLTQVLERNGHQVLASGNAEDGIAVCKREMPDLVLMDVILPGMNGFQATRQQINSDVESLNANFGQAPGVSGQIGTVTETWLPLNKNAQQVIDSERAVLGLAGNANSFVQRVPQLQAQMDEVVRAMLASGSASSQVYLAVREGILAATMARRVAEIQAGGPGAQIAGDALARDAGVFGQVLQGLHEGGAGEAQKVTAPAAVASLNQANTLWTAMQTDLDAILSTSQNLFRAQSAADAIATGSNKLLTDAELISWAWCSAASARCMAVACVSCALEATCTDVSVIVCTRLRSCSTAKLIESAIAPVMSSVTVAFTVRSPSASEPISSSRRMIASWLRSLSSLVVW